MTILGLDVGRNCAVGVLLEGFPSNIQQYFRQNRRDFLRLKPRYEDGKRYQGIKTLEDLNPDGIVLEPTGLWYSAIWAEWAKFQGIPIYWVGHADLNHQRGCYGFANKRDDEDALCLAATFYDDRWVDVQGNKRFLTFYDDRILEIRKLYLEQFQWKKNKGNLVRQLRQRLCLEFPEIAQRKTEVNPKLGYSPLWGWLADMHSYSRIINEYDASVAQYLGIPLSRGTRVKARHICESEAEISYILECLATLIGIEEFKPYLDVFRRFRFGFDNQVLLLIQCYPFSKFLVGGKPWIDWEDREIGGNWKRQKRNRSMKQFQAYLGLSYKLKQSGDTLKKKFYGSKAVRASLYMWATSVALPGVLERYPDYLWREATDKEIDSWDLEHPKIPGRMGDLICKKIIKGYKHGVKGSDIQTRLLFRVTDLLFRELLKSTR